MSKTTNKSPKIVKKTFPLRLEVAFSDDIDKVVFHTKSPSKHEYIMEAIRDKVKKDFERLNLVANE